MGGLGGGGLGGGLGGGGLGLDGGGLGGAGLGGGGLGGGGPGITFRNATAPMQRAAVHVCKIVMLRRAPVLCHVSRLPAQPVFGSTSHCTDVASGTFVDALYSCTDSEPVWHHARLLTPAGHTVPTMKTASLSTVSNCVAPAELQYDTPASVRLYGAHGCGLL